MVVHRHRARIRRARLSVVSGVLTTVGVGTEPILSRAGAQAANGGYDPVATFDTVVVPVILAQCVGHMYPVSGG